MSLVTIATVLENKMKEIAVNHAVIKTAILTEDTARKLKKAIQVKLVSGLYTLGNKISKI